MDETVKVIPAINSSFSHHIAAGLENGDVIVGQNSISHPSATSALDSILSQSPKSSRGRRSFDQDVEDANLPGTLLTLRTRNIQFSKEVDDELPARIERIWYINPYGQEMCPPANPRVIDAIRDSQAVIYSIGSLFTSIIPSIILRGVGDALRNSSARHKILILNGSLDREVGPPSNAFTALDFVNAIAQAGEESRGITWRPHSRTDGDVLTLDNSVISLDLASPSDNFSIPALSISPSRDLSIPSRYVTHLIYMAGEGTPKVDKEALATLGIHSVKLYGRRITTKSNAAASRPGLAYDPQALIGAIETILGKKGDAMTGGRSRRNTLDA